MEPLTPIKEPTDTRSGLSNMKPGLLSARTIENVKSEYTFSNKSKSSIQGM
jgi:hypothetical protein